MPEHQPVRLDREAISDLMHGSLALQNPIAERKLDDLLEHLDLTGTDRVLDVGCGRGEVLIRVAERTGAGGVGIDLSAWALSLARQRAAARAPEVDLAFVQADARAADLAGPFRLGVCVGSTHALGDLDATLAALATAIAPDGWVLLGEGFWRRDPSPGYLDALGGASADELRDLAGLLAAGEAHGLRPVALRVASDDDWDAYEWTLIANGDRHVVEHPDQPGIEDLQAWVDEARARISRPDGRETLGFALVLLRSGRAA